MRCKIVLGVLCDIPSDQEKRGLNFRRLQDIQQFRRGLFWPIFKCRRPLVLGRTVYYIVGTATVTEPVTHTVKNFGGTHGRVAGLGCIQRDLWSTRRVIGVLVGSQLAGPYPLVGTRLVRLWLYQS